jgi:hypothetical protein
MFAIYLKGPNDRNGNPVRCYLILDNDGDAVDAVDEGYAGHGALKRDYPDVKIGATIATTAAEVRGWLATFDGRVNASK